MKRFGLFAACVMAAFAIGGCQSTLIGKTETVVQKVKSLWNNKAVLTVYDIRAGFDVAQSAAAKFKTTACPSVTSLGGKCAVIVPKLRSYNKQAIAALDTAENFVRSNPTLDASVVINAAKVAVTAFAQLETDNAIPPS